MKIITMFNCKDYENAGNLDTCFCYAQWWSAGVHQPETWLVNYMHFNQEKQILGVEIPSIGVFV